MNGTHPVAFGATPLFREREGTGVSSPSSQVQRALKAGDRFWQGRKDEQKIYVNRGIQERAFHLEAHLEYVDYIPMADCIGFSVQRRYPASCRYKPPVKRNGEPDTLALIVVVYQPDRRDPNKPYLVPIVARVSVYNRYVAKHLDYDFTDDECPTEESVVASNKTPRPIELSSINDYFFDHNNDRFLGADTKVIDGIDIIDGLFKLHLATVDKLKGAIFRWRLNNINRKARCYGLVLGIFKWLLKLSCGQTLESDNMGKGILEIGRASCRERV